MQRSMMYYPELVSKIVSEYGSQAKFADAVGITKQQMTKKLTKKSGFSADDIVKWCNLLDIDKNDIPTYFFNFEFERLN